MLTIATPLKLWTENVLALMLKQAFMGNYVVVFGNGLSNPLKGVKPLWFHMFACENISEVELKFV